MAVSPEENENAQNGSKPTGFPSECRYHDEGRPSGRRVPLSAPWITEELLDETCRVWSKAAGRPITDDEAVEILLNVRNLAYALIRAKMGGDEE